MNNRLKDLTGLRFGKLTVIERAKNSPDGKPVWKCICDCGHETLARGTALKQGYKRSCGCLKKRNSSGNYLHGQSKTLLYRKWLGIKSMCYQESHVSYKYYSRKGIEVCDEWRYAYEPFRDWAIANGYEEGMQVLRKDKNGPFSPENCYIEKGQGEVMNHGKE